LTCHEYWTYFNPWVATLHQYMFKLPNCLFTTMELTWQFFSTWIWEEKNFLLNNGLKMIFYIINMAFYDSLNLDYMKDKTCDMLGYYFVRDHHRSLHILVFCVCSLHFADSSLNASTISLFVAINYGIGSSEVISTLSINIMERFEGYTNIWKVACIIQQHNLSLECRQPI